MILTSVFLSIAYITERGLGRLKLAQR